jgi:hypothetical protein
VRARVCVCACMCAFALGVVHCNEYFTLSHPLPHTPHTSARTCRCTPHLHHYLQQQDVHTHTTATEAPAPPLPPCFGRSRWYVEGMLCYTSLFISTQFDHTHTRTHPHSLAPGDKRNSVCNTSVPRVEIEEIHIHRGEGEGACACDCVLTPLLRTEPFEASGDLTLLLGILMSRSEI